MPKPNNELLIELFSEEIPARMQAKARGDLARLMSEGLKDAGLSFDSLESYSTPRRLCMVMHGLPAGTPDISEERRGPRADAPEQALAGFLRGVGMTRDQLVEREDKKGTFLYALIEKKGRATADVVAEVLANVIKNFPWPKQQRWGSGSLRWVRPLHSILCLLGGKSIIVDMDGVSSGAVTNGHRFMAPDAITVTGFADYKAKLLKAKVMIDQDERAVMIADAAKSLAAAEGLEWVEDKGLLTEVAGLVEWPVPLLGSFDPAFMAVPEEVLILTMKKDQKYFVCRDPKSGKLAPNFITVSNIEASDGGTIVAAGNQRVLSARLSDAKFFWDQDLKGKLDDLLPKLDDIVFHEKLGTVAERVGRIKVLAGNLADVVGCDKADAERAAEICKADLVSNMVSEFASLQGVMGRYYALEQGEKPEVAGAVRDHYAPKGPDDACPTEPVSVAVALAEKIDTLVGFFGINQKPTGSKDPFALRRAALGVIRLITENNLRVSLVDLFGDLSGELVPFFADRLKVQQREKGVRHDLIDAAGDANDLVLLLAKVAALTDFVATDDGVNLLAGYKRAANILAKASGDHGSPSETHLVEDADKALFSALSSIDDEVNAAISDEDFGKAMALLSTLRAPIDGFFDHVMVNDDDAVVRGNRLAMLSTFTAAVNRVADFSKIEG